MTEGGQAAGRTWVKHRDGLGVEVLANREKITHKIRLDLGSENPEGHQRNSLRALLVNGEVSIRGRWWRGRDCR